MPKIEPRPTRLSNLIPYDKTGPAGSFGPGIQHVEPGPLITLRPKHGIKVRVHR